MDDYNSQTTLGFALCKKDINLWEFFQVLDVKRGEEMDNCVTNILPACFNEILLQILISPILNFAHFLIITVEWWRHQYMAYNLIGNLTCLVDLRS